MQKNFQNGAGMCTVFKKFVYTLFAFLDCTKYVNTCHMSMLIVFGTFDTDLL